MKLKEIDNKLLEAVERGDVLKVKDAVSSGANANVKGEDGSYPIHIAAMHPILLAVQIVKGATVTANQRLQNVVRARKILADRLPEGQKYDDIMKELLNYIDDINVQDIEGKTALHHAAINKHANRIKLLAEKGANFSLLDNENHSPLYHLTPPSPCLKAFLEGLKSYIAHQPMEQQKGIREQKISELNKHIESGNIQYIYMSTRTFLPPSLYEYERDRVFKEIKNMIDTILQEDPIYNEVVTETNINLNTHQNVINTIDYIPIIGVDIIPDFTNLRWISELC